MNSSSYLILKEKLDDRNGTSKWELDALGMYQVGEQRKDTTLAVAFCASAQMTSAGWDCGLVILQRGAGQGRLCSLKLKQAPWGASALCASPPSQGALRRLSPRLVHNRDILNQQKRLYEESDHCSQRGVSDSHLRKTRICKAHMKHTMSLI